MNVRLVTPPAQEPVSLADAKAHLRLEEDVDDVFVQAAITAARQHIEKVCWRGMLTQTLELELAAFRGEDRLGLSITDSRTYGAGRYLPFIELSGGHLAETPAVVVTYLDAAGASVVLSPSTYVVQGLGNTNVCGRLWLNTAGGYSWPDTLAQFNAVRVQYNVGWEFAKFPKALRQAVLLLVSQMYEYRTPEITGTIATELEFTIDALTSAYRLLRL